MAFIGNKRIGGFDDDVSLGGTHQMKTVPIAFRHTFYLSGVIESPGNYTEIFEAIRNADPNDEIMIRINSVGGDLATAIQFYRVMSESQAHITCSIEGDCASAATIIYLSADAFEVSAGGSMMFHDYSTISYGKGNEMHRQVTHEKATIDAFLTDAYTGFLKKREIKHVLDGQDLWLDYNEIVSRTNKLMEHRSEQKSDDSDRGDELLLESKPKPKKKK